MKHIEYLRISMLDDLGSAIQALEGEPLLAAVVALGLKFNLAHEQVLQRMSAMGYNLKVPPAEAFTVWHKGVEHRITAETLAAEMLAVFSAISPDFAETETEATPETFVYMMENFFPWTEVDWLRANADKLNNAPAFQALFTHALKLAVEQRFGAGERYAPTTTTLITPSIESKPAAYALQVRHPRDTDPLPILYAAIAAWLKTRAGQVALDAAADDFNWGDLVFHLDEIEFPAEVSITCIEDARVIIVDHDEHLA